MSRFIVLLLCAVAPAAMAQHSPSSLRIGIYQIPGDPIYSPASGQCLIRGNNGKGDFVRHDWGNGPELSCGLPSNEIFLANGQAVFDLVHVEWQNAYLIRQGADACLVARHDGTTSVASCNDAKQNAYGLWHVDQSLIVDEVAYASIRSSFDNRCLIFGNNGYDTRPTLYRWSEYPDDSLYCGLHLEDLVRTGQGLWSFTQIK